MSRPLLLKWKRCFCDYEDSWGQHEWAVRANDIDCLQRQMCPVCARQIDPGGNPVLFLAQDQWSKRKAILEIYAKNMALDNYFISDDERYDNVLDDMYSMSIGRYRPVSREQRPQIPHLIRFLLVHAPDVVFEAREPPGIIQDDVLNEIRSTARQYLSVLNAVFLVRDLRNVIVSYLFVINPRYFL